MAGKIDPTFITGSGFDNYVSALALQPNGQVIVGGAFTTYNGINCPNCLVRLNPDGTLDTSFNNGGSGFSGFGFVYALALHPNGKIIVGGDFFNYNGNPCPGGLVRLNPDGSIDSTFNSGGTGIVITVSVLALQPNGQIIAGGNFPSYNGNPCPNCLVRVNPDGTLDTTFNSGGAGFDEDVLALALQPNGQIIVGGLFTTYNGADCPDYLVRINLDGTLDPTFNSGGSGFGVGVDNGVFDLALQPNGQIIVGGLFTSYNGTNCPDSLVRVNFNGTLDSTFNNGGVGFDNYVSALALQANGQIIVGGGFTSYDGSNCPDKLARINPDGTLDPIFNNGGSGFNFPVSSLALQPNSGKIIVGGFFTSYNDGTSHPSNRIIRLTAYSIFNYFQGESFGIRQSVKSSSLKVNSTFKIPISNDPAQEPGSISIDLSGIFLKVRKPGGDVGSVVINIV